MSPEGGVFLIVHNRPWTGFAASPGGQGCHALGMQEPWRSQLCPVGASMTGHEVIKGGQGGRSDVTTECNPDTALVNEEFCTSILVCKNQSNDVIIQRQQ